MCACAGIGWVGGADVAALRSLITSQSGTTDRRTNNEGTKDRGRERRTTWEEGKGRDKCEGTSDISHVAALLSLLFWLRFLKVDPCERTEDGPARLIPLSHCFALSPSNFLSASLMASLLSLLFFTFSPSEGQLVSFNMRNWRQIKLCCISGYREG